MKYISVDIETTSLNPKLGQVLQVCCILENTELEVLPHVKDLPRIDVGLWATHYKGDEYAMGMNEKLLNALGTIDGVGGFALHNGRKLQVERDFNAWKLIYKFIAQHSGGKSKVHAAGKNVSGFDLQFFPYNIKELFHHRVIDVGSVALGAHARSSEAINGVNWEVGVPSMRDLLGAEPSHDALDDAMDNISIIREVTNYYGRGPGVVASHPELHHVQGHSI